MEDIEDGECSSDGDSIAGYTPIERPTDAKPSFKPAGNNNWNLWKTFSYTSNKLFLNPFQFLINFVHDHLFFSKIIIIYYFIILLFTWLG